MIIVGDICFIRIENLNSELAHDALADIYKCICMN